MNADDDLILGPHPLRIEAISLGAPPSHGCIPLIGRLE
jgi:hypothetical protein